MKILVIEDNPLYQEAAKQQLAEHEVVIMKSFTEFFNKYSGFTKEKIVEFDAVLTDINLPSPIYTENRNEQAPTGLNIALFAITNQVKYVGILTDAERHGKTAMGYSIDLFEQEKTAIGTTIFFPPAYAMMDVYPDNLTEEPELPDWFYFGGGGETEDTKKQREEIKAKLIRVKNWSYLLGELIG